MGGVGVAVGRGVTVGDGVGLAVGAGLEVGAVVDVAGDAGLGLGAVVGTSVGSAVPTTIGTVVAVGSGVMVDTTGPLVPDPQDRAVRIRMPAISEEIAFVILSPPGLGLAFRSEPFTESVAPIVGRNAEVHLESLFIDLDQKVRDRLVRPIVNSFNRDGANFGRRLPIFHC